MIKGRKLLWAMSSILLLSACTPTEAVTDELMATSSIESSVAVASVPTDTEESKEIEEVYSDSIVPSDASESAEPQSSVSFVCGKINVHTIAAQKYTTPQAA